MSANRLIMMRCLQTWLCGFVCSMRHRLMPLLNKLSMLGGQTKGSGAVLYSVPSCAWLKHMHKETGIFTADDAAVTSCCWQWSYLYKVQAKPYAVRHIVIGYASRPTEKVWFYVLLHTGLRYPNLPSLDWSLKVATVCLSCRFNTSLLYWHHCTMVPRRWHRITDRIYCLQQLARVDVHCQQYAWIQ